MIKCIFIHRVFHQNNPFWLAQGYLIFAGTAEEEALVYARQKQTLLLLLLPFTLALLHRFHFPPHSHPWLLFVCVSFFNGPKSWPLHNISEEQKLGAPVLKQRAWNQSIPMQKYVKLTWDGHAQSWIFYPNWEDRNGRYNIDINHAPLAGYRIFFPEGAPLDPNPLINTPPQSPSTLSLLTF